MKIIQQFSTNNTCYKMNLARSSPEYATFQDRGPQGIVLHSVGCNQSQASVFANTWNRSYAQVAVHAVLQADGTVIQCLPWNYLGWHVGGKANQTHIGVEMTEPDARTPDARSQIMGTYNTAVELFAYLCKTYNIDPSNIISHSEAYKMGLGSNHADPELLWRLNGMNYTMDTFRAAVRAKLGSQQQRVEPKKPTYKVGDTFTLKEGATYYNGAGMPKWLFGMTLYIRSIRPNGDIVFSRLPTGLITGVIKPEVMQLKN